MYLYAWPVCVCAHIFFLEVINIINDLPSIKAIAIVCFKNWRIKWIGASGKQKKFAEEVAIYIARVDRNCGVVQPGAQ